VEPKTSRETPAENAAALLAWTLRRFPRQRVAATTGFGLEGCVLVDLLARLRLPPRVLYLDTHFLFPETYALRDRLAARYPRVRLRDVGTRLTAAEQEAAFGPALWSRDPDACCRLRKVEPLRAALRGADVWITGLRREQSAERAGIQAVEWDAQYEVVKVNPLAGWTRSEVWQHVRAHEIPYNPLHLEGYPSIGCTHCTRRVDDVDPDGYSRAGRWAGTGKTECGLHRTAEARR